MKVIPNKFNKNTYGKTKLICWPAIPIDPTLSKKQEMILQNFGELAFFHLSFSVF